VPEEVQPTPESGDGAATPTPVPVAASGDAAPAGFVPQAELDRAESARRELQSKYDKLHAERREAASAPTPPTPPEPADPAALLEAFERRMELREAKSEFKSDERFKSADPSLFDRATTFDSREAFEAALLESAQARTAERQAIRAEVLCGDSRGRPGQVPDYKPDSAPARPRPLRAAARRRTAR
jgi:hypothetical protein